MAAIFQIQRGTTDISIHDGELYLHKGKGSLQFGSGSNNSITLLPLNVPVTGDINLSGSITASGDVRIGGNIYLGDNLANDSVNVNSPFSGSIIPSGSNVFDLGSTSNIYRNVYASTLSASVINAPQFNAIATITGSLIASASLQQTSMVSTSSFSSSISGVINQLAYFDTKNSLKGTGHINLINNGSTVGFGTETYTTYEPERIVVDAGTSYNIATFQTSKQNSYAEVNIKNFGSGSDASTDLVLWNDQGTESSSYVDLGINSSNYSVGYVGYGSDGYLINAANDLYVGSLLSGSHGHLHLFAGNQWKSSSISIYNDGTVGINTDKLNNNATTIPTTGFAVEISGSVKFDNNINVIGTISASQISGLEAYTSSLKTAITASGADVTINGNLTVKGTTTQIDSTTLNIGDNVIQLNGSSVANAGLQVKDPTGGSTLSGSLLWDSTSDYWKGGTLGNELKLLRTGGDSVLSGSSQIDLTQTTNYSSVFNALATITGSLINTASSHETRLGTISTYTSSLETRLGAIATETASIETRLSTIQTLTASVLSQLTAIGTETASIETRLNTIQSLTSSNLVRLTNLESTTASLNISISNLNIHTASLNTWSASINNFTASMTASYLNLSSSVAYLNGIAFGTLNLNDLFTAIGVSTGSLNTFTSSANVRLNNIEAATSSYEIKGRGIVSGSSQLASAFEAIASSTHTLLSGSAQVLGGSGVWSGSAQMPAGVVSGSSQIVYGNISSIPSGIVSGAAQVTPLLPSGVVSGSSQLSSVFEPIASSTHTILSGSSQILGGSGIHSGSYTGNNGIVSSSAQVLGGSGVWSGSAQLPAGVVSGSSQLASTFEAIASSTHTLLSGSAQVLGGTGIHSGSYTGNNNIVSGAAQIPALLPSGVISGSSQLASTFEAIASSTHTLLSGSAQFGNYIGTITGTANQITVAGSGLNNASVTLSTPQAIATTSDVQFNNITASAGIRATGDIVAYYSSDERLKENVQPIQNALSKVELINGNTYDWKEGFDNIHPHKGNDVGVIAQEIEKVLPQVVVERQNGYKAVNYEKIVPLLIEAIKELSAKVKELENK